MSIKMHKLHDNKWLAKEINRPPNISLDMARFIINFLYSDSYKIESCRQEEVEQFPSGQVTVLVAILNR